MIRLLLISVFFVLVPSVKAMDMETQKEAVKRMWLCLNASSAITLLIDTPEVLIYLV